MKTSNENNQGRSSRTAVLPLFSRWIATKSAAEVCRKQDCGQGGQEARATPL